MLAVGVSPSLPLLQISLGLSGMEQNICVSGRVADDLKEMGCLVIAVGYYQDLCMRRNEWIAVQLEKSPVPSLFHRQEN